MKNKIHKHQQKKLNLGKVVEV